MQRSENKNKPIWWAGVRGEGGLFLIEQRAGVGGAITLIPFTSYRSTWATRAKKKIYEIWQNSCAIRTISGSIFVVFKATLNIKLRTEKEKEREQEADRREEGKITSSWSEAGGERARTCLKVPLVFFSAEHCPSSEDNHCPRLQQCL